MDYNKVIIGGRLTRDPDVRKTGSGLTVCNISIATNRKVKKQGEWTDEVLYVDAVLWGTRAEAFAKYHKKGQPCFVEGCLQLDQWEKDGQKRSKIKINVDDWRFVGGKSDAVESDDPVPAEDDTPF